MRSVSGRRTPFASNGSSCTRSITTTRCGACLSCRRNESPHWIARETRKAPPLQHMARNQRSMSKQAVTSRKLTLTATRSQCLGGRRYIHERLQQCPEQERLIALAQKLAIAAQKPVSSIRPLEVGLKSRCRAGNRHKWLSSWTIRLASRESAHHVSRQRCRRYGQVSGWSMPLLHVVRRFLR